MRFLTLLCLFFVGCCAKPELNTQLGLGNRNSDYEIGSEVSQVSGRDVFNVSPTIAITGSGGLLLFFVMLAKMVKLRQVIRIMVLSIEEAGMKELKSAISKKAFRAGVSDYVYRMVVSEKKKVSSG